ncbi:carbon storage regulator CsrA [Paeniglutamicibacter cryotolerans]|uniref:Translational regulator CsrA n=1 Tax=Paeniglutamicibacter cryotolerans TaxID=670079 RepID=A0A839QIM7_9MICC|nr:carbon storage regulator CsrA [Paeniglutamicibacter cryotolerans]MBB2993876.1 carbon storage regulator [Paeniglutamicibacter cryotolerans]
MLVLTRKVGEQILIGEDIVVTVLDVRGESIKIGIDAPKGVRIQRQEVIAAVAEVNRAAAAANNAATASRLSSLLSGGMPAAPATPTEPDA